MAGRHFNIPLLRRRRYGGEAVPAAAIRDRADDPILDRAGAYILERV